MDRQQFMTTRDTKELCAVSAQPNNQPSSISSGRHDESLDWQWLDWREWACDVMNAHDDSQIADTMADMGQQMNMLRQGLAAEARIVEAQVLSLNPKVLGKGRREIVVQQVRRMYSASLARELPRGFVSWGRKWTENAEHDLNAFEAEERSS